MTLRFEGSALVIRKADNTIRFDTDEGLFHGINWLTGSFGLSARQAVTENISGLRSYPALVDATTDVALKPCHVNCTHVLGFSRATRAGGNIQSEMDGLWKDCSGTVIDGWSGWDLRTDATPSDVHTNWYNMGSMTLHTFYVSGGNLRFKERIVMVASVPPVGGTFTLTRPAVTVEYQVLTGFFL